MKKFLFTMIMIAATMAGAAQTMDVKTKGDTTVIVVKNPTKYMILPVEETTREKQVLLDKGLATDTWMDVRLAEKKVDYNVPFELGSGQKAVTRQDIDAITGTQLENRIFEMIDAITDGNQAKALSLYADLLSLKEPPMRILYLIARQYNQLLTVRELMDEGNSAGAIVQRTGMRDFVVRRNMNRAKSFSVQRLRDNVAKCIEMEESVKTGRIGDRLSVELLLVQFSEQRKS